MKRIVLPSTAFWGITLLVTLIAYLFILPLLPAAWQAQVSRIMFSLLFLSAIFSLDRTKKPLLVFMLIVLCMEWIAAIFDMPVLTALSKILNVSFFVSVVAILIGQVAMARHVTMKVIFGSVIGYLLLGLVFSIFVNFIMVHDPLAFNVSQTSHDDGLRVKWLSESIYFTFVSLATLGYGDILPLKPYTRSLAILITVSGQLYIAIIIALLVGKFASVHKPPHADHPDQIH